MVVPCRSKTVTLFGQFYLLLRVAFPIQKWPYFSQFCVFFPKYNEKSLHLFPNIKVLVASQNLKNSVTQDNCLASLASFKNRFHNNKRKTQNIFKCHKHKVIDFHQNTTIKTKNVNSHAKVFYSRITNKVQWFDPLLLQL